MAHNQKHNSGEVLLLFAVSNPNTLLKLRYIKKKKQKDA